MKSSTYDWTKTYTIDHTQCKVEITICSTKTGYYSGLVFYYVFHKNRLGKATGLPIFELKTEQFADIDEQTSFTHCLSWINQNLNGHYSSIRKVREVVFE